MNLDTKTLGQDLRERFKPGGFGSAVIDVNECAATGIFVFGYGMMTQIRGHINISVGVAHCCEQ
jgi:hypothetical protein